MSIKSVEEVRKQHIGGNGASPFTAEPTVPDVCRAQRLGYAGDAWAPCQDSRSQRDAIPMGVIYNAARKQYVIVSSEDTWIQVPEAGVKRYLQQEHKIIDKKPKSGLGSKLDEALNGITRKTFVAYAGTMPGYLTGVYLLPDGQRMLVTSSPKIIKPKAGDWSTIRNFLTQLLGKEQVEYFHGWLSVGYRSISTGVFVPGQCLAMAGVADCGKTFAQHYIITPVLGGREAKPYQYMTGATPFNLDLFNGEHLIISDEVAHTDLASRRMFGTKLKDLLVNPDQRLHAKHSDAVVTRPCWRMSLSANDEPEELKILPPIDHNLEDKIILLLAHTPDCLPQEEEQRVGFLARITSEIPAYVDFLSKFKIDDQLKSGRFGITHYHNPDLLAALDALAPENELMTLIDQSVFSTPVTESEDWEGTAAELTQELTKPDCPMQYHARKLLSNATTTGIYLSRLVKKRQIPLGKNRVRSRIIHGVTVYSIEKPVKTTTY